MAQRNYSLRPIDFEYTKARLDYDPFYQYTIFGDTPRSKAGGKYFVTMINGTGVGPELMDAVQSVFSCANVPVIFDKYDLPGTADENDFQDVLLSIRRNGACIKENVFIRHNLYGRTSFTSDMDFHLLQTKINDIDVVLVRQNIEGEYAMLEHEPVPGVVQNLKVVTRHKTERLARYTFEMAKWNAHQSVKCVILENVTPEIFTETVANVAKDYPEIEFDFIDVRNAMMRIMHQSEIKEVLIVESMHGSVITRCILGLLGSPGLTAGCNYGDRYAIFEPAARARCTSIAGKGIVNPAAALMCGVELLRYLELSKHADLVEKAVIDTLQLDRVHTPDLGGTATTDDFTLNVIDRIRKSSKMISLCSFDKPPLIPKHTSSIVLYDPECKQHFVTEMTGEQDNDNCK
ncbi:isocitrate dehydrogenase [NAD] subunit gamma, mitochondrial-like [Lycorma delicatula]|uniref:isocitrate dehydrogenase [NAD] subunit gamma, mitochondrial-like n=1 Tax=Lycorma delicatula TaxID=130591 RepID=UPI003F5172B5